MGASLMKLTSGDKKKEELIKKYYGMYFKDEQKVEFHDFYQAVCATVEAINEKFGDTQIRIPNAEEVKRRYDEHFKDVATGTKTANQAFQEALKSLVSKAGFTNAGALGSFLCILGLPVAASLLKHAAPPKLKAKEISNDVLIPGVTSATVLILAVFNKI